MSSRNHDRRQRVSHRTQVNGGFFFQSTAQFIESLDRHLYNTLTDLCRVERCAPSGSKPEEDQRAFGTAMTAAWRYHVTSNNLLNELRQATPNYPFSSDCLDYAKWAVDNDPESNRSWNYAWLVLIKIRNESYVESYAHSEAAHLDMWGGRTPTGDEAKQLADCFAYEWNAALNGLLRNWSTPPVARNYWRIANSRRSQMVNFGEMELNGFESFLEFLEFAAGVAFDSWMKHSGNWRNGEYGSIALGDGIWFPCL